jgi:hypothetical protein
MGANKMARYDDGFGSQVKKDPAFFPIAVLELV